MLHIIKVPGGRRSVITCDVCQRRIVDATKAVAMQPSDGDPAVHAHKGGCHDEADRLAGERGQRRDGWMTLDQHVVQAMLNTAPYRDDEDEADEYIEVPGPSRLAATCMEIAWADATDDDVRVVLEQCAIVLRRLSARCVTLASESERAETRRPSR